MYQEIIMPLIGALLLVGWMASGAWALRPSGVKSSGVKSSGAQSPAAKTLAAAQVARALTRNGLLGVLVMVVVGFLAVRLLFELPGWFQLAWVIGMLLAAYIVWRVVILWPSRQAEQRLLDTITAHGMRPVRPPWGMIAVGVALIALWLAPPLILF